MNHNTISIEYDILDKRNHRKKNQQQQRNLDEHEKHVKFAEKLVSHQSTARIVPTNLPIPTSNQIKIDDKVKIVRPKSANLSTRKEVNEPKPWIYYASCDDRDLLRMEKDALNSRKTYQDRFYCNPVLNDHNSRFEMKERSVSRSFRSGRR
jgi:hypothetical protein